MKVIIFGASGETGRSIVKGLLESATQFDITAVSRKTSLNSKNNDELKKLGVQVVAADLKGPADDLVGLLKGADVVISSINATVLLDQIPLVDAAKKAGVGRFIPCTFATACPPMGVMKLRETKEKVLNHIKKIYLPYTIIDVGWWYEISPPRVPSGRIDYGLMMAVTHLFGDGSAPSGLTYTKDIGKYVARIIADPRTLNNMVYVHNELWTQRQIFDKVEELSGEKLERNYLSGEELQAQAAKLLGPDQVEPADTMLLMRLWGVEYQYSWGIRGDNTPENAKYLGYLLGKELYPDVEFTSFESYLKELLEGKARKVYV
ncbi:isoflavone reductase family protein [Diaporthe amygdali]|uniref:isoflavone reductase family protein n=1 Tax=Phomopsis amygdali TaxID=1214568 RepID=UPI0022FE8446|nr:isoflavone reductase family protein [Diaporthe amygdali]KAJ0104343.1 isoflavone reductase family protein [Diaporthe amygdali]